MKKDHELIKGLISNQSEQASREIEALRAKVDATEMNRVKAAKAAKHWKAEANKSFWERIWG